METITRETRVGELARFAPEVRHVFERHRVDYCCGGKETLAAAAEKADVSVERLIGALEEALAAPAKKGAEDEPDWDEASLASLADHIEAAHHAYLAEELPRIERLLEKVQKAHAEAHGDLLSRIAAEFTRLRMDLQGHLEEEEKVLFPALRQLDWASRGEGPPPDDLPLNVMAALEAEHEEAGALLDRLRELTGGYGLPDDACPSFEDLYDALEDLESDLHEHIHLENNVLFPRARDEFERAAEAGG